VSQAQAAAALALPVRATDADPPAAVPVPAAVAVAAPYVSIEVVAIAAGLFALVQFVLWLTMPSELLWLGVSGLAVARRWLYERGHDLVFARPRLSRGRRQVG
jgi:hypothetical protein